MSSEADESNSFSASGDAAFEQYDTSFNYGAGGNGVSGEQQASYGTTLPAESQVPIDATTQAIIDELRIELTKLDPAVHKGAIRLINNEIDRLTSFGEPEYLEVDINKPIRIVRKVLVPVHRNPKFNFVGKLLGPGGKTLQSLIQNTRCRIYILGRGSSREKAKEEELLVSGEPKYAHFKDPLYVRVESSGPPTIAYQKIAHVLNELQYYLQPVKDDIYIQQMHDMGKPVMAPPMGPPVRGGMRGALMGAAPGMRGGVFMRGAPRGMGPTRGRGYLMQTPPGPPSAQGNAAAVGGQPPGQWSGAVTYPGYDYSGYGEYQHPQTAPAQTTAHYGSGQAPPPPPPPPGPQQAPTAGPPVATGGAQQTPPVTYGASAYTYNNYTYGYDYSQYSQPGSVAQGSQQPRMPGQVLAAGGGKAPAVVRGRGMARPAPY